MPVPSAAREGSPCQNLSNRRFCCSCGICGPWLTIATSCHWPRRAMRTSSSPPSGENLMALSSRFTHTSFKSSSSPVIMHSGKSASTFSFLLSHFFSKSRMQRRSCSDRLNSSLLVRMVCFSILVRLSTLVAMLARRVDSSTIMPTYSCRWLSVRSGRCRILAKPRMETMGVLNSCEKLFTKSERSISVFSSSLASELNASPTSFMADVSPNAMRSSKWPLASLVMPRISFLTGSMGS